MSHSDNVKSRIIIAIALSLSLSPGLLTAQQEANKSHQHRQEISHAEDMHHERHKEHNQPVDHTETSFIPLEAGQATFAAIQEIVSILMNDPETDWTRVSIDSLREHLVDMQRVILQADATQSDIEDGIRFDVTSASAPVSASIRTMVLSHAETMTGINDWTLQASEIQNGASLIVIADEDSLPRIRALGFFGLLTLGMHHQAHHLAIARGHLMHAH